MILSASGESAGSCCSGGGRRGPCCCCCDCCCCEGSESSDSLSPGAPSLARWCCRIATTWSSFPDGSARYSAYVLVVIFSSLLTPFLVDKTHHGCNSVFRISR